MTTSAAIRTQLVEALQLDLVGPTPEDALHAEETIPQAPSLWYLTGFLVPYEASLSQRSDDTGDDDLDEVSRMAAGDDETTPEAASAAQPRPAYRPSHHLRQPQGSKRWQTGLFLSRRSLSAYPRR